MPNMRSCIRRFFSKPFGRNSQNPSTPFYRKYPYLGGVGLKSVDSRGVVDFDFGFFFNRVPKSGNTTLMTNLAKLKNGGEVPAAEDLRSLFPLTPAQLSAEQVERFEHLFKFTFVRNPYSRVLSAYLDKIVKDDEPGRRRKMRKALSGEAPSFEDFVRWLAKGGLYEDVHWAPQSSILVIPVERFDFVGKLERLEDDFQRVMENLPASCRGGGGAVQTFAPHSTGAGDKESAYYTKELREIIARLYREDFELFGYEY
jgi:hypothetical protein